MDVRAFVEKDPGDTAGNFGGNGGAATRGDVAAGIQESLAAIRFGCGDSRDVDYGLSQTEGISGHYDAGQQKQGDGGEDDSFNGTGVPALALGDVQGAEVMLWGIRRCRHSRRCYLFLRITQRPSGSDLQPSGCCGVHRHEVGRLGTTKRHIS